MVLGIGGEDISLEMIQLCCRYVFQVKRKEDEDQLGLHSGTKELIYFTFWRFQAIYSKEDYTYGVLAIVR